MYVCMYVYIYMRVFIAFACILNLIFVLVCVFLCVRISARACTVLMYCTPSCSSSAKLTKVSLLSLLCRNFILRHHSANQKQSVHGEFEKQEFPGIHHPTKRTGYRGMSH